VLPPILPVGLGYWESKRYGSSYINTVDFGELVRESSKMKILSQLLIQLKRQKHRYDAVLFFLDAEIMRESANERARENKS
jgi:hypothetical protein